MRSHRGLPGHPSPSGSPQTPFQRHWSGRERTESQASAILREGQGTPGHKEPPDAAVADFGCSRESAAVSWTGRGRKRTHALTLGKLAD